jgi:hypothetical protein
VRGRRLRVGLGLVAAVVLAGALAVPVVLTGGGGSHGRSGCRTTLRYARRTYVRRTDGPAPTQRLAIGVGVSSGCGARPANVDVRSLSGIAPSRAVGVAGDGAVYARTGLCAGAAGAALTQCLQD